jgi:hypothetical protein
MVLSGLDSNSWWAKVSSILILASLCFALTAENVLSWAHLFDGDHNHAVQIHYENGEAHFVLVHDSSETKNPSRSKDSWDRLSVHGDHDFKFFVNEWSSFHSRGHDLDLVPVSSWVSYLDVAWEPIERRPYLSCTGSRPASQNLLMVRSIVLRV